MKYVATILVLLALALGTPDASAQPFPRQGRGEEMVSLNTILGNIRRQFPGQLSDVQGPFNGHYLIKWLTPDGQILFIETDARTGQVLGVRGGGAIRQNFEPGPSARPDRARPRTGFDPDQWVPPSVERRRDRVRRMEGQGQ